MAGRRDHVSPEESGDGERRLAVLQYHVWRARVSVQCSSNDSSRHGVCGCV